MHGTLPTRRSPVKTESPFQFRPDESPSDGWHRILGELTAERHALHAAIKPHPSGNSIHACRTLIKRLRALAWFAKPALPTLTQALAKKYLREAAGLLAPERDAAVIRAVLQKFAGKLQHNRSRAAIIAAEELAAPAPSSPGNTMRSSLALVQKAIEALENGAAETTDWARPKKRIRKAHQIARTAGKKALRSRDDADFHEWRKKAKRLMYELTLARPELAHSSKKIKTADKLQKTLGDRHDLVLVQERLQKKAGTGKSIHAARMLKLVEKRKKRLDKKARKLAV